MLALGGSSRRLLAAAARHTTAAVAAAHPSSSVTAGRRLVGAGGHRRPAPAWAVGRRALSSNPAHFQYHHEAPAADGDMAQEQQQRQQQQQLVNETPARWLRRKALEGLLQFQQAAHGELGAGAVATLKGLAALHAEAGQAAAAVDLLERALAIQIEAFGGAEDHPEAIDTMRELIPLYGGSLGQPLAAMRLGERYLVAVRRAADGHETEAVALATRDVARLKGFVRDHTGKRALLERALALQRRLYARELGGSEHHVEVLRTRLFLAAAQVAGAATPALFSGMVEASALASLEEAGAAVDLLLEVQAARGEAQGREEVALSLALLHAKAMLEGEMGRGKEKAELLQELLVLRERFDGADTPTHAALDVVIDLAETLAKLKRREEARTLLEERAVRMQEGLVFSPAQAVDVAIRSALAWGALGELGTRVRMLERAHSCLEIFLLGSDASEQLVQAKLELSEAVRLMGDRQRADLLAAGAEEARAKLERQVGFPLRDDARRLRLAAMLESLGERYF